MDSYSTDDTRDIGIKFGAKILTRNCGMTSARNYGARHAEGEYLYHMDTDMKLPSNLVEECVRACEEGADGVIIPQRYEGKGFFGKCKELEIYGSTNDDVLKTARFVRRTVFKDVGGYDENVEAGEDWDIAQRIESRYKLIRISSKVIHGSGGYDFAKWMRKCYRYGKTIKYYRSKHKAYAKHQWSPLRFLHFDYPSMIGSPHLCAGLFFIKFCEFFSGWLGSLNSGR